MCICPVCVVPYPSFQKTTVCLKYLNYEPPRHFREPHTTVVSKLLGFSVVLVRWTVHASSVFSSFEVIWSDYLSTVIESAAIQTHPQSRKNQTWNVQDTCFFFRNKSCKKHDKSYIDCCSDLLLRVAFSWQLYMYGFLLSCLFSL